MRLAEIWQDARLGWRALWRRPGFAIAALLTLALGIGATTSVFSVVRHVLLAPLPYRDADRVVMIWSKWRGFDKTWLSDAEAADYKAQVAAFDDAGAWSVLQVNLTGDGEPVRIGAAAVTSNLFGVLGTEPLIGRQFTDADAAVSPATAAILGYGLWQSRYAGDTSIVGRTIQLNGRAVEVVGVMPPGFQLPTDYVVDAEEPTRLWLPFRLNIQNRGSHGLHGAARLRVGTTVAQANAELSALTAKWTSDGLYPVPMQFSAFALSVTDEALGGVRPALLLLFGAVLCLLLIACANVANLLLVRADARSRELAVRSALGADRARLVRQLLTESGVLALAAAAVGMAIAYGVTAIIRSSRLGVPRAADVSVDLPVLLFSIVLAVATLAAFSLLPALRAARARLAEALRDGSQQLTAGSRKQRLRTALVVAQTAVAVVLLAGAVLMARSLWKLQEIDLGFDPRGVLTMRLALPAAQYDTPEKVIAFYDRLLAEVRGQPGVSRAGLIRLLPLAAPIGDWGLTIENYQPPPGLNTPGDWQIATEDGIEALGERIVRGRGLAAADTAGRENVALINEAMAARYWAGQDPLGRRFRMGGPDRPWITVVGIVANVRHNGVTAEVKPKFYRAFEQWHLSSGNPARNMTLVVRATGDPMSQVAPIRARIRALDGNLPIAAIRTMDDVIGTSIATPKLTGRVLSIVGLLALTLAAIGMYGVLSYVVSQRRQEFGIRLAIGAGRRRVLGMVLSNGIVLAVLGLGAGLAVAAVVLPFLSGLLYGVEPFDPVTFLVTPAVLLVVATIAAIIPAWRATRVDPIRAIREVG
jgi:putative ABC transport system permease protein